MLERVASDSAIMKALDDVRLARGYSYAEQFAGTNGIGTTLETGAATSSGRRAYVDTWDGWHARVPRSAIRSPASSSGSST